MRFSFWKNRKKILIKLKKLKKHYIIEVYFTLDKLNLAKIQKKF